MNYEARFGGIGRLYGRSGLDILRNSRMAVVGIGGVGSWAAEALARSGVGAIILMDLDDLCITNTNRQIHALETTIGQSKTEAMAACPPPPANQPGGGNHLHQQFLHGLQCGKTAGDETGRYH